MRNITSERRSDDVHTPEFCSDEVLTDLPRELSASTARHDVACNAQRIRSALNAALCVNPPKSLGKEALPKIERKDSTASKVEISHSL